METGAEALARHIVAAGFDDLPPAVVREAKLAQVMSANDVRSDAGINDSNIG